MRSVAVRRLDMLQSSPVARHRLAKGVAMPQQLAHRVGLPRYRLEKSTKSPTRCQAQQLSGRSFQARAMRPPSGIACNTWTPAADREKPWHKDPSVWELAPASRCYRQTRHSPKELICKMQRLTGMGRDVGGSEVG